MASLSEEWSEDKPRTHKRSHSEEKEADVANQKRDRGQSWPSPGTSKKSTLNGHVPLGSRNDGIPFTWLGLAEYSELLKVKKNEVNIEVNFNKTKKALEDQKTENEALKTELQFVRSSRPVCKWSSGLLEKKLQTIMKQNETLENDKATIEAQNAMLLKEKAETKQKFMNFMSLATREQKRDISLYHKATKALVDQKAENEALKACDKKQGEEIVQLKATNDSLSMDLNKAIATCSLAFRDRRDLKRSTTKLLEEQKAEIEALKACDKEKEAEIVQLKVTNGSLSIDLDKAKANCNIFFDDEQQAKIEALKAELKKAYSKDDQTSIKEACLKELEAVIVYLKATNSSLSIELDKAKTTCDIVFEDEQKECKCSVTKILNSDLQKKVNRMKELLDLREKEIRLLNDELKNSE
jgi:hypothetical protein